MLHRFNHLTYHLTGLLFALSSACSSVGDPGPRGEVGASGSDGEDGNDGENGRDGENGAAGRDGKPGRDSTDAEVPATGRLIELAGERTFPEGIAIDGAGFLYTGSIPSGEITQVEIATGKQSLFSNAARNAIGLLATDTHLLVCDVGMTTDYAQPSAVLVLDLRSGSEVGRHEFPAGAQFCNDMTVDESGNVYATESFANSIFRLSAGDLEGDAALTLFSNEALFSANMVFGNFGLNGISFDGDSTLHVVNFYSGELFAVPILQGGEAGAAQLISLKDASGNGALLAAPDGMKWAGPETLMVSEQSKNALSRVDLKTGVIEPVAAGFDVPSTFTFDARGDVWVVNSQLDDFMAGSAPRLPFTLEKVPLD